MIEAGRALKRRLENIFTLLRHRITNTVSKSINSKFQWVKYTNRVSHNKQNFQSAIYKPRNTRGSLLERERSR